jgi:penicillin-binding protein 1A
MMMAIASDIKQIQNYQQYKQLGETSYLYDDRGTPLGVFSPPTGQIVDKFQQISPYMRRAVVAVEDQRFWSEPGVDIRGIARAFIADVSGGSRQGASTIAEQFIKNALQEENNRTILEKVREAAMAYHLSRRWPKQRILSQYLNSVYFGNGAYGVESAARVYFKKQLGYDPQGSTDPTVYQGLQGAPRCGNGNIKVLDAAGTTTQHALVPCALLLEPWQAALLAGMISNPSGYDPVVNRFSALARRNLVLTDMLTRGPYPLSHASYKFAKRQPLPTATDIQQPSQPSAAPYFTSWVAPQVIDALRHAGLSPSLANYRAYFGGLKIKTTLDLQLQQAADQAVAQDLPWQGPGTPTASMVAIDNKTGQVRAMVGGPIGSNGQEEFSQYPFNLATEGQRQPGSAFKPFTLAVALEHGFGPSSLITSAPFNYGFTDYKGIHEIFQIRNFGNAYSGVISLAGATAYSDNSAFAGIGLKLLPGPHCRPPKCGYGATNAIAAMAHRMGIRTPVSNNPAMILGGLATGVSPLDMAHAYETLAEGGRKVYDPVLGAPQQGPTGIAEISCGTTACEKNPVNLQDDKRRKYERILPSGVAATETALLRGPVDYGTATRAQIAGVVISGKTGTTSNYGDAWFVGWTPQLTVAVWVGAPDKLVSMATDYQGGPVEGGTYPAMIWHDFMVQALQILATENPPNQSTSGQTTSTIGSPGSSGSGQSSNTATSSQTSTTGNGANTGTTAGTNPGTTGGTGGGGNTGNGGNTGTGGGGNTGTGNGGGGGTGGGTGGGSSSGGAGLGGGGSGG